MPPLTDAELSFLRELDARGVRFVVIGMGAAVLQGATAMTQDLDLWFESLADRILASERAAHRPKDVAQIPVLEAAIAVRDDAAR